MATTAAHANDTEYLVRNAMTLGYQVSSLLAPPAYVLFVVARRGPSALSLNRVLRAAWIGGFAGTAGAGGLAYARYAYSNEDSVRARRIEVAYNTDRIRRDDHATIGTVIMGVLTPALLWKRANVVNLILGGAGLGSTAGLLVHYSRSFSGDPPPKTEIIIPVSSM